jgi:hypothetical protein
MMKRVVVIRSYLDTSAPRAGGTHADSVHDSRCRKCKPELRRHLYNAFPPRFVDRIADPRRVSVRRLVAVLGLGLLLLYHARRL